MGKIRVYELARELNIESKILLVKMKEAGIIVNSHQSTLTQAQVDQIRALTAEKQSRVVVRRRKKVDEAPIEAVEAIEPIEPIETTQDLSVSDVEAMPEQIAKIADEQVEIKDPESKKEDEISPLPSEAIIAVEEVKSSIEVEIVETAPEAVAAEKAAEPSFESPKEDRLGGKKSLIDSNLPKGVARSVTSTPSSFDVLRKVMETPSEEDKAPKHRPPVVKERRQFVGATIVRKATPEEAENTRAQHEIRNKPNLRKDEVSTQRPAQRDSQSQNETSVQSSSDDQIGKWVKDKKERVGRVEEEEAKARVTSGFSNKKRVSTRELLSDIEIDSSEEETSPWESAANKRRKTIYTPGDNAKRRAAKRKKDLKKTQITTPRAAYRVVKIKGTHITAGELAKQMSVKASEVLSKLMSQGMVASINQDLEYDVAALLASDFGFECKNVVETEDSILELEKTREKSVRVSRPPIITVMGHVDHGKTSILDAIRQSDVCSKEFGGITQHIGAYTVNHKGQRITFLDTPGHEAFSEMRSRGARLTDLVVLVVAADDGVKPQTIEAISHAKQAGVPLIVAINKIDKPNLNFERVFRELADNDILAEEWGGEVQVVKVSALKKQGLEELLEAILIQNEMLELTAYEDGPAEGVIVEAHLEVGRGPVATVILTNGRLKVGDFVVAGEVTGKVRLMENQAGQSIKEAGPTLPFEIFGLTAVPMAGDLVNATKDERVSKELAEHRRKKKEVKSETTAAATLDDLIGKVNSAEIPQVPLLVKADTQGSLEAIISSLAKMNSSKVRNIIVHKAVGGINETDINLAETAGGVILGFNVRAIGSLKEQAEKRGVVVQYFSVIYELIDAVRHLMAGKLPPICTEVIQGHAEVRNPINIPKIGIIAGSSVMDGKITRSSHLRLIRDDIVIFKGKVGSLRRFKDDVKEVLNGYECGIGIDGYTDVRQGDRIEAFMIEEKAAVLDFEV